MKTILEAIKERRLYLDGGLGSMLQAAGLPEGLLPDLWSIQNPETCAYIPVSLWLKVKLCRFHKASYFNIIFIISFFAFNR